MRNPHACGGEPFEFLTVFGDGVVIPTPVGVNREAGAAQAGRGGNPHACGGEPSTAPVMPATTPVIPTPVGVNRMPKPILL